MARFQHEINHVFFLFLYRCYSTPFKIFIIYLFDLIFCSFSSFKIRVILIVFFNLQFISIWYAYIFQRRISSGIKFCSQIFKLYFALNYYDSLKINWNHFIINVLKLYLKQSCFCNNIFSISFCSKNVSWLNTCL